MTYPLGRLPAPDTRDLNFLMASVLPVQPSRRSRYFWSGWFGDQGATSSCVGFSWTHWLTAGPVTQLWRWWPDVALSVYTEAQKVDEWDGENYEGTSVRAGAKVLQSQGFISEYRWAFTIDEVLRALIDLGPVVVGTVWTEAMFFPDEKHFIKPDGPIAGGHAYLLDGANLDRGIVRIKNSWGRSWGRKGRAYITVPHLAHLLDQDGEAAIATELRP